MSGLRVIDDTTLKVTLNGPFSQFPLTLGYTAFYPLPTAYAEDPKAFEEAPMVQGDFGTDFRGREVTDIMAERFPVTVRLTLSAFAFELVLGLAAGVLAGLRRGSLLDNLVLVTTVAVVSIPVFVLGFTAQILFGVRLGWFPIAGLYQGWTSYLLPGMVLGALSLAYVARLTRTSLVENLRADYVRTATAKGMPRSRVVGVHALRNSLIPVITFLGVDLGALMGGAIVTEGIFNIPGVGQQVFLSIQQQESTVVVGIVTALVLVFILANLLVDMLYAVLDPRIRYD
jgi:peptide/nickel transport system permease protein/oligopeptide transport system permease protein